MLILSLTISTFYVGGNCSSCTGKIVKGTADQGDANFLNESSKPELANTYILTCVAYPTSDMTIETDKEEELMEKM